MLTGRQESKISRRQKEVLACRAKRDTFMPVTHNYRPGAVQC